MDIAQMRSQHGINNFLLHLQFEHAKILSTIMACRYCIYVRMEVCSKNLIAHCHSILPIYYMLDEF